MANDTLTDQILNLEKRLLIPETRSSQKALSILLADDFIEFGSSGRRYNKEDILEALAGESSLRFELSDFALRTLAPGVALATYQVLCFAVGEPAKRSLRSSIWILRDGRWQMLFHQGTLVEDRILTGNQVPTTIPPSTRSTTPDIKLASSDARKR